MSAPAGRELTEHEIELARVYASAGVSIRAWQETRDKARDQLAASLGEDIGLVGGRTVVTVSRIYPERFDSAAFKADHELTYRSYLRPSENAVVTVRVAKGVLDGADPA